MSTQVSLKETAFLKLSVHMGYFTVKILQASNILAVFTQELPNSPTSNSWALFLK
jgi:hypothetical protein